MAISLSVTLLRISVAEVMAVHVQLWSFMLEAPYYVKL
jgi:hypothetical protein